jgi:DNA polymerase-1
MKPNNRKAYKLLHDGCIALANVEANGMRVDVEYLDNTIQSTKGTIKQLEEELRDADLYKIWRREFGTRAKLGSREQLAKILFGVMGHKPTAFTKTGKPKMDGASFETIDDPFVAKYLQLEKHKKINNTFLAGIKREVCDGFLHPSFNLHRVQTYRSSSDSPNFQNFPIRDPVMGEVIRRCFIPREDRHIVEIDYSGIEVRVAACYHKDPAMLSYIEDPSKDMHRDMAAQCYAVKPDQVSKGMRYCGKNMFVFPQFYGDYYLNNAKALWEAIDKMGHEVDGVPLKQYLKTKGIQKLGTCNPKLAPGPNTFEKHIQKVERDFWDNRFQRYAEWKKKWWELYLKNGGFSTLTGFHIEGVLGRNDVINYPVQGSAFHCLLWSLIKLNKQLRKRKMKSLIVGQIHDSIVADVHKDELQDYLQLAKQIMTEDLREKWKWIITPLDVEAEVTPINGTWHEKKEQEIGTL